MQKIELYKKYKSGNALEIIRDAVLAGDISGEISQNEFADSLGVSRIPVREALIALEYQGLVEKLPNQHVRVITLDDESIRNLFADMSILSLNAIQNLSDENIHLLSLSERQQDFHRYLYEKTTSPLRKIFLRTAAQTYLAFILEHSDGKNISPAFENLKRSLGDPDALKTAYSVYAEVLADELIRIRRENKEE